MSLAEKIRGHLPYLRRYARALTGTQQTGDNLVKATLETIISAPDEFDELPSPRAALYRVFHKIWESSYVDVSDNSGSMNDLEKAAQQKLAAITPQSRQVLLLTSLEGFGPHEVAAITGCSETEVEALMVDAINDLDRETQTSVLIIEDEPLISMELEQIVRSCGHEISATAATHKDAIAAVENERPGLVLADIQLADGSSGIDAVREILGKFSVPVIFVTAYPERLLTGTGLEPTFLITKPFHPNAIRAAISQALFFEMAAVAA